MSLKDNFSFLTGVGRFHDLVYAALVEDARAENQDPHSVALEWDAGTWRRNDKSSLLGWVVAGVCVTSHPVEQGIFVGMAGEVLCMGSGDIHNEAIVDGGNSPRTRGPLRAASSVDGRAYAVGMDRQVYRRDDVSRWVSIDADMRPEEGDPDLYGFDSIDGFSQQELYAAGVYGEIWRYDGNRWRKLNSPTNLILAKVCCAEDGKVYIGGQKAVLLRGRDDSWDAIAIDLFDDDIWGLAWYRNRLYISTLFGLYTLGPNDEVLAVDIGKDRPTTFYHLSAADGVLWSIGRKDVMKFDGSTWVRIE